MERVCPQGLLDFPPRIVQAHFLAIARRAVYGGACSPALLLAAGDTGSDNLPAATTCMEKKHE
jgi:hypothetical protein